MSVEHFPAGPHGAIQELFDGLWFVKGEIKFPMAIPMKFCRAMTIARGEDGLVLFNSMRLSDAGLGELEALGEVKHIVRLAGFHGRDDAFYQDRYGAKVWAVEGQGYYRGLDNPPKGEPYLQPDAWLKDGDPLPIEGARVKVFETSRPPEALALFDREGGVVVSGDAFQHMPKSDEFFNLPAKLMMKAMGFLKPYNVGPGWLKFAKPTVADVRSVLELDFEHLIPSHGDPVLGGAKEKFRPVIEGPLKGARP